MAKWLRKWFSGWRPEEENGKDSLDRKQDAEYSGSRDSGGSALNLPEDGSVDDSMSAPDERWNGEASTGSFMTNDSSVSIALSEAMPHEYKYERSEQQSFEYPEPVRTYASGISNSEDVPLPGPEHISCPEAVDSTMDNRRCSSVYGTPEADITIREVVLRGDVSEMEDDTEVHVPETSTVPRRTVTDRVEPELPDRSTVRIDSPEPGTSSTLNFVGKRVTIRATATRIPSSSSFDDTSGSGSDTNGELDWENKNPDAGGRRVRTASRKNGHRDSSDGSPRNLQCPRCLTTLSSEYYFSRHTRVQPQYCKKLQDQLIVSGRVGTSSTTTSMKKPKKNLFHDFALAEGGLPAPHQVKSSSQGTSDALSPGYAAGHKKTRKDLVARVVGARKPAARMLARFKSQPSVAKQPFVKRVVASRVGRSKSQALKDQPVNMPLLPEKRGGVNTRKVEPPPFYYKVLDG